MRGHTFISYKREDVHAAELVYKNLRNLGLDVWWDKDIQMGQSWNKELDRALLEAHSVVVLWSKYAVNSPWVMHEASIAKLRNVLVSITIDKTEPPTTFTDIQYGFVDVNNAHTDDDYTILLKSIKSLIIKNRIKKLRAYLLSGMCVLIILLAIETAYSKYKEFSNPIVDKMIPEWSIRRDSIKFMVNTDYMQDTHLRSYEYIYFACQGTKPSKVTGIDESFSYAKNGNLLFFSKIDVSSRAYREYLFYYPMNFAVSLGDWVRCRVGVTNSKDSADLLSSNNVRDNKQFGWWTESSMNELILSYSLIDFGYRGGRVCICDLENTNVGTSIIK